MCRSNLRPRIGARSSCDAKNSQPARDVGSTAIHYANVPGLPSSILSFAAPHRTISTQPRMTRFSSPCFMRVIRGIRDPYCRKRSNNFSAGSSAGSWGTSWPAKARARIDFLLRLERGEGGRRSDEVSNSASTCPRALANRASSWSASANNPSIRRTFSFCSAFILKFQKIISASITQLPNKFVKSSTKSVRVVEAFSNSSNVK